MQWCRRKKTHIEKEEITEPQVKARDVGRTNTSLLGPVGLTVFITLTNTIPASVFLFCSHSFLHRSKPFHSCACLEKEFSALMS